MRTNRGIAVMELLLADDRIDVNAVDEYGDTVLHHISECADFNPEVFEENEREERGPEGRYRFPISEILKTLELLLHSPKVDVNIRNQDGCTALHYCADEIYPKKLEIALKAAKKAGIDVNIKRNDGMTAAHCAFRNDLDHAYVMVKYGKEVGIDFEARDDKGKTPMHHLCQANHDEKVQKFLRVAKNRFNIEFDLEATDENGATPLELVKK